MGSARLVDTLAWGIGYVVDLAQTVQGKRKLTQLQLERARRVNTL